MKQCYSLHNIRSKMLYSGMIIVWCLFEMINQLEHITGSVYIK